MSSREQDLAHSLRHDLAAMLPTLASVSAAVEIFEQEEARSWRLKVIIVRNETSKHLALCIPNLTSHYGNLLPKFAMS
jgi:aspartyl/asparaginyl beta-hydroxylase (cupin superfamily)